MPRGEQKIRILSIVPATGWVAVYANLSEPDSQGRQWYALPFPLWALIEETDSAGTLQRVVGLDMDGPDGTGGFCDDIDNFLGYAPIDALDAYDWDGAAQAHAECMRAAREKRAKGAKP